MNILFLLKPKKDVSYLYEDEKLRDGGEKIRADGYTAAPVLSREGHYVGTVNEGDFLRHILDYLDNGWEGMWEAQIRDIIRTDWNQPVHINATVDDLLERVLNQNFVPVVDDRNLFVGIITRRAVIRHFEKQIQKLNQKMEEKGVDG